MKKISVLALVVFVFLLVGCATAKLPKDSTFAQKAAAVCGDLDASVMLAQIGLTYAQNSNWAYDYSKAQITLVEATSFIKASCSAAQTEKDLLTVRNVVLAYLANASRQQTEVQKWK